MQQHHRGRGAGGFLCIVDAQEPGQGSGQGSGPASRIKEKRRLEALTSLQQRMVGIALSAVLLGAGAGSLLAVVFIAFAVSLLFASL